MIKLEVGVSDKIWALCLSRYLAAYFTANLLNGGNDIIFFLSVCVIIVTHLWLPAIHDREEEKGRRDDEEGGGGTRRNVVGSSGSPRFRKKGGG